MADSGDGLSVKGAVQYWIGQGVPREKLVLVLVLGLACFGKGWKLNPEVGAGACEKAAGHAADGKTAGLPSLQEEGTALYFELLALEREGEKRWDASTETPYLVVGRDLYTYDDVESFEAKLEYAKQEGLGGAFTWALDYDDFLGKYGEAYPLHTAILKSLGASVEPEQAHSDESDIEVIVDDEEG